MRSLCISPQEGTLVPIFVYFHIPIVDNSVGVCALPSKLFSSCPSWLTDILSHQISHACNCLKYYNSLLGLICPMTELWRLPWLQSFHSYLLSILSAPTGGTTSNWWSPYCQSFYIFSFWLSSIILWHSLSLLFQSQLAGGHWVH